MSEPNPIRFENIPVVKGPLQSFNAIRPAVLEESIARTIEDLKGASLELLLEETLYLERIRLKRARFNPFTRWRAVRDRKMLSALGRTLLLPPASTDRTALARGILGHFAEEIGGRFDPPVYKFATQAVPWGFSWLLNAASMKHVLPWGMTERLESRLRIVGHVTSLQKLAAQGTILLVPTHMSNIDSVLIGYLIYLMSLPPFAYGAGLNLYSNPALSYFMSNLGAYTVDRQKTSALYKTLLKNYSTTILRRGVHSIFFPGGGRSRSGAIESKLKLGLLGTGLEAELANHRAGKERPRIFVVPMTMSYHFVLEAGSLIEDYLTEEGKHRFMLAGDESFQALKILGFFWKLFSSQNEIVVRIGRALDVFGNPVDDEGRSIGPNGTTIDPVRWLTTRGELRADAARDHEYTRILGTRLVERFHRENTVLTSHLVAFSLFESLRARYPDLDLYRFLRLSREQRAIPFEAFAKEADARFQAVRARAEAGEFHLSDELRDHDHTRWIEDGVRHLGILHDSPVARIRDGEIWSDDLNLLYYYRNRLAGYGLGLSPGNGTGGPAAGAQLTRGAKDGKGFLV